VEHQLKEPLKQIFSVLLPNAEAAIFGPNCRLFAAVGAGGANSSNSRRELVKRFQSGDPTMHRFLQPGRQQRCVNCERLLVADSDCCARTGRGLQQDGAKSNGSSVPAAVAAAAMGRLCAACLVDREDLGVPSLLAFTGTKVQILTQKEVLLVMLAQTRVVEASVAAARELRTCLACTGKLKAAYTSSLRPRTLVGKGLMHSWLEASYTSSVRPDTLVA
jgi:hypothetical protein